MGNCIHSRQFAQFAGEVAQRMGPRMTPIYANAIARDARSPVIQDAAGYHRSMRQRATIIDCVRRLSRRQRSTLVSLGMKWRIHGYWRAVSTNFLHPCEIVNVPTSPRNCKPMSDACNPTVGRFRSLAALAYLGPASAMTQVISRGDRTAIELFSRGVRLMQVGLNLWPKALTAILA